MRKALIALVLVAIAISAFTISMLNLNFSKNKSSTSEAKVITVTDAVGRNVTLTCPVKKIVVTDDEVAELIQLLGAADKVVGIEPSIKARGYFPEMANKPITGSQFRGLNYELIAKLKPDVVILMNVGPVGKIVRELEKIGVKSVVISIRPEKIPETIKLLGKILGKENRAKKVLEWWFEKWNILKKHMENVETKKKLKVFVGMGFSPSKKLPTRTWGKFAKWNYILNILNMENIASNRLEKSGELDLEYIVKENPDIIIVGDWSDSWLGYTKNTTKYAQEMVENIVNDPVLKSVRAVREGKVFIVHYVMLGSFRSVIGAFYLAKIAYPEAFKDINPEDIHREYFEKLLGIPYEGLWFYPKTWLGEGLSYGG